MRPLILAAFLVTVAFAQHVPSGALPIVVAGGGGSGAFVQSAQCASAVCSLTGVTVGNAVIFAMAVSCNSGGAISYGSTTDNQGNTYSTLVTQPSQSFFSARIVGTIVGTASGTFTVTGTPSSGAGGCQYQSVIAEYSGTTLTVDQTSVGANGNSPITWGSVTTTFANDIVISVADANAINQGYTNQTWSATSPFVQRFPTSSPGQYNIGFWDNIRSSTGTVNGSFTCTGGNCGGGGLTGAGVMVAIQQ